MKIELACGKNHTLNYLKALILAKVTENIRFF